MMSETEILEIHGKETLCRWELVKDAGTDFPTYRAVPIITKEQFLACYNKWIRDERNYRAEESGNCSAKMTNHKCYTLSRNKTTCDVCGADLNAMDQ